MNNLYVISALGQDRPGLVSSVTTILRDMNINIVDINSRSVRGHFIMFLVVDLSTSDYTYQDMVEKLDPVRSNFSFGLHTGPYKEGRRKADKNLMLLTVMGADRPGIVASLSELFAENSVNIEKIKMIARGEYIAMEVTVDTSDLSDVGDFRKIMFNFSDKTGLDVSLREDDIFKKPKRVVVFDCDSTIIQGELIDKLANIAGVGKYVEELTARAMNGKIDFKQAINERVSLLKGLTTEQLELISKNINLTPGAEELISTLRSMGYKIGVISGGFSFFTDYLKKRLNLDYVFANELEIADGVTTGKIKGDIVDAKRKGEIIKYIAQKENISPDQIVAVGDGANDRFMLKNAGLGIAFNPKQLLKEYSHGMITANNLSGLRYFLGIPEQDKRRN